MDRDEYNGYKRTILQSHIYNLIFEEGNEKSYIVNTEYQGNIVKKLEKLQDNKKEFLFEVLLLLFNYIIL